MIDCVLSALGIKASNMFDVLQFYEATKNKE